MESSNQALQNDQATPDLVAEGPALHNVADDTPIKHAEQGVAAAGADPEAPSQVEPEIIIDEEFASLLPPPSEEELKQLEANLLADGVCHDALVVWKGRHILLGGHNRLSICRKHEIAFKVVEIELPNREAARLWIIMDQLGRRNVPPEWVSYRRGELYNAAKKSHGGDRKSGNSSAHDEQLKTTAEKLAAQLGTSPATIRRDGEFAEGIDKIGNACGDDIKQEIIRGTSVLTRQDVSELAKEEPSTLPQALKKLMGQGGKGQGKGSENKANSSTAKAKPETITVPTKPVALAKALVDKLGRKRAQDVHDALGKTLAASPQVQESKEPPKKNRKRG